MRDDERTNEQQLKIELLSQWKLEAESRKNLPRLRSSSAVKLRLQTFSCN